MHSLFITPLIQTHGYSRLLLRPTYSFTSALSPEGDTIQSATDCRKLATERATGRQQTRFAGKWKQRLTGTPVALGNKGERWASLAAVAVASPTPITKVVVAFYGVHKCNGVRTQATHDPRSRETVTVARSTNARTNIPSSRMSLLAFPLSPPPPPHLSVRPCYGTCVWEGEEVIEACLTYLVKPRSRSRVTRVLLPSLSYSLQFILPITRMRFPRSFFKPMLKSSSGSIMARSR